MTRLRRYFGLLLPLVLLLAVFSVPAAGWSATGKAAAGAMHSAVIQADGSLWAWGANGRGQLGDSSTVQQPTPVKIPTSVNWAYVAAGGGATTSFTLAVKADGTLWAWGDNSLGQLGFGLTDVNAHPIPTKPNNDTDWLAVAAGLEHAVAVKADGTLRTWGRNRNGQLSDASATDRTAPVAVALPGSRKAIAVAAGGDHTLVLAADGTVWTSGGNRYGQLGQNIALDPNGNTAHSSFGQVLVSGGGPLTNVVAVAAGLRFSAALKADGTIWTWGRNDSGQLGINSAGTTESNVAVPVVAGAAVWRALAAGADFVLAAEADGHLFAWGNNSQGQLALGNTTPAIALAPVQTSIADPFDWRDLAAGESHAVGIKANGAIYGWGDNINGQVGDGSFTTQPAPVQVASDSIDWVSVEPGDFFTLGRKSDGSLWGWGDNSFNKLGLVGTAVAPTRIDIGPWTAQSGGGNHSAAILSDGSLFTWGDNSVGQLGNGDALLNTVTSPSQIGTAVDWTAVSTGFTHTVVLNAQGEIWAAGDNSFGQLGKALADPTTLQLIDAGPWKAVVAGDSHTVALKADGSLWAWGDNSFGQLGDTTTTQSNVPKSISAGPWTAVAAGFGHTLALKADGTMHAWGLNAEGQLGDNSTADKLVPTAVSATGAWTSVAAGSFHSLARKSDGTVYAWGRNAEGQAGTGVFSASVQVPSGPVAGVAPVAALNQRIGAGNDHSAAITADGRLWLWGGNLEGQLGNGTSGAGTNSAVPATLTHAKVALSPASLSFGAVVIGATSDLTLTVGNAGTAVLTMGTVTGLAGTDFSVITGGTCGDGTAAFNVTAGASCTLQIRFTPTLGAGINTAAKVATLSMTTSSPDAPSVSVSLAGTAQRKFPIVASFTGNGTISPVGTVLVDPNASQLFTIIADAGNKLVDVVVDGVSVGPVTSYLFTDVTASHTIAASFAARDFADSWTWRNPLPTGHSLRRIAGNGTAHVAVGDYGTILRSTDNGASWSMIENGTVGLNGVAFGNGTFVTVGNQGRILTSTDGLAWTPRHSGTRIALRSVTFGNGTFVAVGNTNTNPTTLVPTVTILTSADGITWTPRLQILPLNTTLDLHDVAFGSDGVNNVFVAAAQGGYLLKSADNGATWLLNGTAVINPAVALPAPVSLFDFNGITFAASTFVAVGGAGQVYTAAIAASPWTSRAVATFADFKGVAFSASKFVTVGSSGEIWTSSNGTAWTQRVSGLEATVLNINGVAAAGSGLVAVSDEGTILASTDGVTWTAPYPQTVNSSLLRDVRFANGAYVAVGDVGSNGAPTILTSTSGTIWASVTTAAVNTLQGAAFGNGLWVAVGESGIDLTGDPASRAEILTSTNNGTSWISRTSGTSLNLNGIAFGNGTFVAVGDWGFDEAVGANNNAVILTSTDGRTWTHRTSPALDMLRRVTYANGRFVAVGDQGVILTSPDGLTWTDHSLPFGPQFTGVAGTTGLFAAVASNSTKVYRSADNGVTWTVASHVPADLPTSVLRGITYAAGQFLAVAESGFIFTSTNASTWSIRMGADVFPFGTRDLRGITYGNGRFVAAGSFGAILQSAANAAQVAEPVLSLSPSALDLAPVPVGATADTVFTITNRGSASLTITSVTSGDAAFTVTTNACATVAPAGTCNFTVRYTAPTPAGTVTVTTLNIVSNDPVTPTTVVTLRGSSSDTVAPVTTASPAAGTFIAPVNVTLSVNEPATIKYTRDGSDPTTSGTAIVYSGPINVVATTTLKYFATDTAGNAEAVKTGVYDIHTPDLVASVLVNGGASVTSTTNVTLTLAATDAKGVISMRFSNDGVTYSADEAYATTKSWTLASGDGAKTVYVRFTDGAGLLYDPVIDQITLDTTAPVTTASPAPGTFIAPFTVTLATNETATIKYTVDGSDPSTSGTAITYTGPVAITATTTLKYFATDLAGNAETVKTGLYTIHTPDLVASVVINNGAAVTNSTAVTLTLSATDATGVTKMRFSNDGVTYTADEAYATSKAWTLASGDGVKSVFVRFTDGAGILYDPVLDQIVLDTTAPVTTASPAAGTFIAPVNVALTANETATIKYTTDGSDPTTSGSAQTYTAPINVVATSTLKYFATDTAGNAETVKTGVYTIHTADLVASVLINGGATTTNNTNVTLTLAATDATGVTSMRFSNDGVTYTADEPYATAKAWTLTSGDGVKTVFVRFTDGAGLLYDPVIDQITLDTTAPVTTASPAAGTFIAPFTVTLTTNEAAIIKYTTDGSDPTTSATANTYSAPIAITATTTLRYFAVDATGNTETVKTGVYTIHTPDLVANVLINGGASVTNSTAVTLTLSATDATGVTSMRFSNDGVTYTADEPYATSKTWTLASGDGVKSVFVRFTDGAGILYDPVLDQIVLDTTAPVTTASPAAGTFIAPVNVALFANESATIKYTVDGSDPTTSGSAQTYTAPVNIVATATLKYFATDTAGNAETVKTGVYTIHVADLVATVAINNGATVTNATAVTLTLAATDATGVVKMRFSNDGITYTADEPYATAKSWTLSSGDGVKTVFVRFTDGAGLLYDPVIDQITLDTTAPVTTASPAAGTFIAPFTVTLTANESATVTYTTDGSDPATSATAQTYSGSIAIAATTTLKYFASDGAGNAEAVKTGLYTIHTADLVASVSINGGVSTTNSANVTLTLTATDAAGVSKMRFSNDGVTYSADEPYATSKAWALASGDGVKTVFVRITDGAGLLYDPVVDQIVLDTVAPVTSASPAAGTFIAPFNVTLVANESASIKYTTDNSDPTTSGTAVTYSSPVAIAATTTLKYFATDAAGNAEAVKTGVYTIHTADLVASVSINSGATTTASTNVTLTLSATDAAGVTFMRFSNDGITYTADEPYATSKAWTLASGDGVKTVYVRFTDGAGLLYDPVIDQITLNANGIRDGLLPGSTSYLLSALRALQMTLGHIVPTPQELAHGDVAPYYSGAAHPDGKIDLGDVSVLLLLQTGTISPNNL